MAALHPNPSKRGDTMRRTALVLLLCFLFSEASYAVKPSSSEGVTAKTPILGTAGRLFEFNKSRDSGVLVTRVIPGSVAAFLLRPNDPSGQRYELEPMRDVIVGVDAQEIKNFFQLRKALEERAGQEDVKIFVRTIEDPKTREAGDRAEYRANFSLLQTP